MDFYNLKDRSLKRSLDINVAGIGLGIVFFTVVGAPVGSSFFTGFMRRLGAGDLIYSVVMALPVFGGICQLFGSYFLESTGRRKELFLLPGLINRLLWIPVAIIPLLFAADKRQTVILIVTVIITVSSVAGSVNGIAFNSWMGDLVPLDIAGRFFSRRALVSAITGGVAGLILSAFIDKFSGIGGFAVLFIIGAVFGTAEVIVYFFIRHPPMKVAAQKPSLKHIIFNPFTNKNYMKLVAFATLFGFGVNVSAPFFNVYMLEHLRMDYLTITVTNQIMSSLTTIFFVQKWGVIADRLGYKPVLQVTGLGIFLTPLVWLFAVPGQPVMVIVANLLAGFAWSGYNVAIFNQSVWMAPEDSRSSYIACFTLLTTSLGTALAYIFGGYFMQFAGPIINHAVIPFFLGTFNSFQALFILSALIRLLALLFLLPMVQEENSKTALDVFRELGRSVRAGIMGI